MTEITKEYSVTPSILGFNIKNIIFFLILLGVMLFSCNEEPIENKKEPDFKLEGPVELTVPAERSIQEYSVKTSGSWEVIRKSVETWAEIKPTWGEGDGTFQIIFSENRTASNRSMTFVILLDGREQPGNITALQVAAQPADVWNEALNRHRPLIHNNDGDDHLYPGFSPSTFSIQKFLDIRSSRIVGTDVSTLSYCTNRSFSLHLHDTEVGERYTWDGYLPERKNIMPELLKMGTDPLKVTANFAHENGLEFFWSHRMNDTHDAAHRLDNPHPQWNTFKEKHPEYLFGSIGERVPHGAWSAVDYTHQEIRDLCVQYFTEVCENYDVDGIELDFFRHPQIFKNVGHGGIATQEQLVMLTDMVSQIREMTQRVGLEKGKPILVLARVPDSYEYCRRIGIDLEEWMRRGLIDILVGGGYYRLNPWKKLVEQGEKYGAKVYADLSESRINNEHSYLKRNQSAVYRARASAAWESGVDGIYSFNDFNLGRQHFKEIGYPEKLRSTNNLYFVTYRNGNPNSYLNNGIDYLNMPMLSPSNPNSLQNPLDFFIEIGDERTPARVFIILYTKDVNPENLEVSINNNSSTLKNSTDDGLVVFEVTSNMVLQGINDLSIKNNSSGGTPSLLDMAILFSRNVDDPALKELTTICLQNKY